MSISNIIGRQRWPFLITLVMVLLEAGLFVLFPLLIGRAIDETIAGSYSGAIALGLLGLVTLLVGAFRRFYDSRVYAKLYRRLGGDLASQKEGTVTA
ncbi:MAG: ABC transporter six-transmembrane domain-containing protein, partial [Bacteroidota bacterium]